MDETLKIVGAITWVAGFIFLLVVPVLGVVVLIVAALLSVQSATKTRERRHQEILDATKDK